MLKPGHLLLERNWVRLARSYEFVEGLERFLLTANNTGAVTWQWRILEAHSSLACVNAREELGVLATVSLVRHGPYEVRLIESPRESENETEQQLWLELFDHHHKQTIDRYRGHNLKDTAAAAELLISKAKLFSQSTD
jgi:hypothetical protein